jgi:hypothetical protein
VIADGKTYYLDLRGKELLERAEKLVDRPVVVTGIPDPASPTLRVTTLKADEFVKETINVEVRGILGVHRGRERPDRWERPKPPPDVDLLLPIDIWWIYLYLPEKSYQVDFGGRNELLDLAGKLEGKSVIVTGMRVGEVIHVTSMKADEGSYRETVTVEIQGILGRRVVGWAEIAPRGYPVMGGWMITAEGKTYTLAFADRYEEKIAAILVNKTVVLTGTLKDGVVTVTGLQPADPNDLPDLLRKLTSIAVQFPPVWR